MKYYILTETFYIIITSFLLVFSSTPPPPIGYVKNTDIVLVAKNNTFCSKVCFFAL
jgi:hypothetical protein